MKTLLRSILNKKGRKVHSVESTATVLEAVQAMNDAQIGCVVILETGKIVGIFTERDVLTRVISAEVDARSLPVAEVMTREVVSVAPDLTDEEAMAVVTEKRCRHLPVVEGEQVVGLVSIGDLTRSVSRRLEEQIDDLTKYITRQYPG